MWAAVPGGVDLLLDCAGGQTRDQAIGAVRDGGRVISIILQGLPAQLERGITGESFAAHGGRERLETLSRLVDAGTLRPQVEAVLPTAKALPVELTATPLRPLSTAVPPGLGDATRAHLVPFQCRTRV